MKVLRDRSQGTVGLQVRQKPNRDCCKQSRKWFAQRQGT